MNTSRMRSTSRICGAAARRRLPRAVFDYIDGGADRRASRSRENSARLRRHHLPAALRGRRAAAQTCARRCSAPDLAMPIILGAGRQQRGCSSRAAKRSPRASPARSARSTPSRRCRAASSKMCKKATTGPAWYPAVSRAAAATSRAARLQRAQGAGYSALVVTIDTPVAGMRERDLRNGMKELRHAQARARCCRTCRSSASSRGWLRRFLRRRRPDEVPQRRAARRRPDALRRRRHRARAVHRHLGRSEVDPRGVGGPDRRQGRPHRRRCAARRSTKAPTRSSSPTTAAGSSTVCTPRSARCRRWSRRSGVSAEVLLDGGIRRGSDVAKALCLGARAVLIGRAYAYGLGAAGATGVSARDRDPARRSLPDDEAARRPSIAQLDRSYVEIPESWCRSGGR